MCAYLVDICVNVPENITRTIWSYFVLSYNIHNIEHIRRTYISLLRTMIINYALHPKMANPTASSLAYSP